MSDKLVRLERLKAVLRLREPDPKLWTAYLAKAYECSKPFASLLLAGKKSFGEKVARDIEDRLHLPRLSLDEQSRSPMALYVADLFDALPTTSQGHLLAMAERFADEQPPAVAAPHDALPTPKPSDVTG